jgi:NAD(P)-dependent dehydrogenase (short-subunit alcohol dehydrogenase family)
VARHVVVTGGGKGIGRATVAAFAKRGDTVIAVGRDRRALDETVAAVASLEGAVSAEVCDVTDEDAVTSLFESVDAVDVLINNAGVAGSAPVHRLTLEDWNRHLAVNSTGFFLCARAVLGAMRERSEGRIVLIASVAALRGLPYTAAYSASKHAAVGFMRSLAAEVAGSGVTANAVCPTYVDTEMTERTIGRIAESTGRTRAEAEAAVASQSPLGRLLEPREVAAAALFLASSEAASINGQTLVLDGGGIQG